MIRADVILIGTPLYFRAPPAKFHAFIERLISIFFFYESSNLSGQTFPLQGKPVGLVATAEYSNPHGMLEYLADFCRVLKMQAVKLDHFPYLGVAGQNELDPEHIFKPYERCKELAHNLHFLMESSQYP